MKLNEMTAHELGKLLDRGEVSSYEITESIFKAIEKRKNLNCYITLLKGLALKEAKHFDEDFAKEKVRKSPLAGIPVSIKDNIHIKNQRTTCGSRILENFVSPYNATVIERLSDAGSIFLGKTNMDEFAMGSSTETSYFGPVLNPHNENYIPGGSSGGSAVSVVANQAILSVGTDTGGSIRQPAAMCGIVGLKPTYGLVSRYGLVAFASSLDQIGPLTKDVEDTALLLNVLSGYDRRDSTSIKTDIPDFTKSIRMKVKGLRVGVPKEYFIEGIDKSIKESIKDALKILESEGLVIEEVTLPHTEYAVATYYLIAPAEASSNLARYDGVKYGYRSSGKGHGPKGREPREAQENLIDMYKTTRSEGFGAEVKRRIIIGTYALSAGYYDAYYLKALKVRNLIKQDFDRVFEKCDIIATPTTPAPPFKLGEKIDDPLQMYLSDIFTVPANLAGIPGISVPCGKGCKPKGYEPRGCEPKTEDKLPVGIQFLAPPLREDVLLAVAKFFEDLFL